MSRKCTKISFGKINRYIFLILVGAIFSAFITFLETQSTNFVKQNKHPIVYSLSFSLGLFLNFILLIIFKIRNKSEKELEKDKGEEKNTIKAVLIDEHSQKTFNINPSAKIHNIKINKLSNKEKYLWILMISIINYTAYIFFCIYWVRIDNYLNTWGFSIGFMSLFSYKLLQMKLYRHHYLCIIIIIIEGLSFNFITQKFNQVNTEKNYLHYISFLITQILFSFVNVMYKYMINKKYIKSYEILFFQGIAQIIFGIIILTITTKINKLDNFFDFIHSLSIDRKEIAIFIALIINQFLIYSIQITIIDIFSPFHAFLMNILNEFFLFFFMIKEYDGNLRIIISTIVCIIICLVMILIFIEIIELNCCGLSYMTKKNIELRAKRDAIIEIQDEEKRINCEGYLLSLNNDKNGEINNLNELYSIGRDSVNSEIDEII